MTRLKFILTTTVITTTALALVYTAEVMSAYHQELIAEVEAEREQLECMEREKTELTQRNSELTKTLQNRTSTLSWGGQPGDWETMPLTTPSGYSAARFERSFVGTGLAGMGQAFYGAERETGVNGVVLAAICAHESDWGSSQLARDKGNLAGLGAYNGQEYSAGIRFDSRADSIMYLARLLATHYAPGGKHYGGSHDLQGIGVRYASDPRWAVKVAGCMKMIMEAK